MKIKEVKNEFGKTVLIDEETRKLYTYNNSKKEVTYNAQMIEDGNPSMFYTNYTEEGTVDDIEERLSTWNNRVILAYASSVGFNASDNDPDKKIWQQYVDEVKSSPDKYFTKDGDFKKNKVISLDFKEK